MTIATFANCVFFLRVKKLKILEKNRLKNCIQENGGQIKFVLNQECSHVVTDDADALSLTHLKTVQKYQLPVVGPDFIWNSVKEKRLLQTDNYELPKTLEHKNGLKQALDHGESNQWEKDATVKNGKNESSEKNECNKKDNMDELRCFSNNNENIPYFPEDFKIAKYDILEKVAAHGEYVIVELQCFQQQCDYPFRIYMHYSVRDGHQLQKQIVPAKTSEKARRIYVLCIEDLKREGFQLRKDFPSEAEYLASGKLQEMLVAEAISCSTLSEEVAKFVELIWTDALGLLNLALDKPVTSISLNDVSRAEGILLQIKKALKGMKSPSELSEMMSEFYKIIPHKGGLNCNVNMKLLSNKQDLCQLIRDMLNVQEINMSIPNPSSLSKYRALRCKIDALDTNSEEFHKVKQIVDPNTSECPVEILQIYKVGRITEATTFESQLGNIQSLIHASSPDNFVGILSRGLLLPKMAVEEHGLERTDCGNLGSGIYFSNSISTSIKYSQTSRTDGTRLLVICDVALGTCWDTCRANSSLTGAPPGYDSVHGVSKKEDSDSAFEGDEFVVYKTSQVKMKYVVKFSLASDKVEEFHPVIQTELQDEVPSLDQSQLEDYKMPSQDLLDNITAGLLDRSGNPIPLKDIHIKGKIIDFVAQIVVFQSYENQTGSPIEAKYVFPLDDTAAVCGFEAFIKGKHIIGEVKEKEKAHQEYRDAISRGDGAYLMDQDAPDIFTVSVGNLPPSTKVLIKITYIMELSYEDGCLFFHLPAAVAPWQQDKALNENTQDSVKKVTIKQVGTKAGEFSLQMSVEMPFKINHISSWTHQLKIKKTDCKAVVHTMEDSSLDTSGFVMEINIGDVHLPRMWVEKNPDKKSEACMLVFQPEFEEPFDSLDTYGETIICLDCSNSMAGSEIQQAKQIALSFLDSYDAIEKLTVIKFGTSFVEFPCNSEDFRLDYAYLKEFIISSTATMGNSDLWKTLHYLSLLYPSEGKRSILLISDGHVQNEAMTLQLVKQNAKHTRIFTCGVGPTANRHMLRSLSQYGAGAFEHFDAKSKYNWERKVKSQKTRMSSPGCNAISIKWQQFDTDAPELMYAPAQIQSLFNHERLLIYGFISNCTQATLHALVDSQELQTMVSTTELQKTTGTMLHKLAARAFIRDYEQGILHEDETEHEMKKQLLKSLIIKLSLENSIVTQFTSFVAIEKRNEKEDQTADHLNVLELVAKEDVDILPYMEYLEAESEEAVSLLTEDLTPYQQICLGESDGSGFSSPPPVLSAVNEDDFLKTLDLLTLGPQPATSQISDTRRNYDTLCFGSAVKKLSAPVTLQCNTGLQSLSLSPPLPLPPPPPPAEYQFSSSSLMGQIKSSFPTSMSGPDSTFILQLSGEPTMFDVSPPCDLHAPKAKKAYVSRKIHWSLPPPPPPPPAPPLLPLTSELLNQKDLIPQSCLFGSTQLSSVHAGPQLSTLGPFARTTQDQTTLQMYESPCPPGTAAYDREQLIPEHPLIDLSEQGSGFTLKICKKKKMKNEEELASENVSRLGKSSRGRISKKKFLSADICTRKPRSAIVWPELFKLQNEDGFWQLTPELGILLDLDVNHLVNVTLAKKGIQSLGPKGKEKLLQLIATLLVLQAIRSIHLEGLVFRSLTKLNDSPTSWVLDPVKKAIEWTRKTEREFPAICQRLELGKDWDSATKKLLKLDVIATITSPLTFKI